MSTAPQKSAPAGGAASRGADELSDKAFRRISGLVLTICGISLPENKKTLVQTRLARRLRAHGLRSYDAYCDLLERSGPEALGEHQELISAITTNVTQFFREPHHFEDLTTRMLPPLIERAEAGRPVRLWSAGCSSGEEPYTIAMTLLELCPSAARHGIKILATDLDRAILTRAKTGVYNKQAISGIPPKLRSRYFVPATDGEPGAMTAGPEIRELISFRALNLTQPFPMRGMFDVIFCRNVVIYFDDSTENGVWRAFADKLNPGGRLFVGHSERVNTLVLPMFESDGVTTYRKIG